MGDQVNSNLSLLPRKVPRTNLFPFFPRRSCRLSENRLCFQRFPPCPCARVCEAPFFRRGPPSITCRCVLFPRGSRVDLLFMPQEVTFFFFFRSEKFPGPVFVSVRRLGRGSDLPTGVSYRLVFGSSFFPRFCKKSLFFSLPSTLEQLIPLFPRPLLSLFNLRTTARWEHFWTCRYCLLSDNDQTQALFDRWPETCSLSVYSRRSLFPPKEMAGCWTTSFFSFWSSFFPLPDDEEADGFIPIRLEHVFFLLMRGGEDSSP